MTKIRAFTLIELLVMCAILMVLGGLLASAMGRVRIAAERTVAVSQMKQVGAAIVQYANETDGRLPGPLKAGQAADHVPGQTDQLATVLGPYVGVTNPDEVKKVKVLMPPMFARVMPNKGAGGTPYVMNLTPRVDGTLIRPWGNTADPASVPMTIQSVPPSLIVLCDADQRNVLVAGQSWSATTPKIVIHGRERLTLRVDGSVRSVPDAELRAAAGVSASAVPTSALSR